MVNVIVGIIVAFGIMSAFWGFIVLMTGICMDLKEDIIAGALMILIPLIAGCIYVGVAG